MGQEIVNGNTLLPTSADSSSSKFKFTGKERDIQSGLDYFGARYYAASMARFVSPDWSISPEPIPYGVYSDPQSLNLYSYVGNNPVGARDDDGHCYPACTVGLGLAVGAGGGVETIREAIAGKGFSGVLGLVGPAGMAAGLGTAGTVGFLAGGASAGAAAENLTNAAMSGKEGTDFPLSPEV